MSVLIRGMQMPSDCRECRLMDYNIDSGKTWCSPADAILADDYKPIALDGRPEWCPLVEIPEKHGRLIDADEMNRLWSGCYFEGSIKPLLDARPTVIEAEGEDK